MNKYVIVIIVIIVLFILYKSFRNRSRDDDTQYMEEIYEEIESRTITDEETEMDINSEPELDAEDEKEGYEIKDYNIKSDDDFMMEVSEVINLGDNGITARGLIEKGQVKVGDHLDIVGFSDIILNSEVLKIERITEIEKSVVPIANKGDTVRIYFSDLDTDDVEAGQILATPNTIEVSKDLDSIISISGENRNSDFLLENGTEIFLGFGNRNIGTKITYKDGRPNLKVGEVTRAFLKMDTPIALIPDAEFYIELDDEDKISVSIRILYLKI